MSTSIGFSSDVKPISRLNDFQKRLNKKVSDYRNLCIDNDFLPSDPLYHIGGYAIKAFRKVNSIMYSGYPPLKVIFQPNLGGSPAIDIILNPKTLDIGSIPFKELSDLFPKKEELINKDFGLSFAGKNHRDFQNSMQLAGVLYFDKVYLQDNLDNDLSNHSQE